MGFSKRIKSTTLAVMLAIGLCCALAETAYWLGYLGLPDGVVSDNCVVLIPGYPTQNDGTPHPVQRLRVDLGVSTYQANH